jgi:hypothetical protein
LERLYNSINDQALITLTGFDFATFHWLEEMFTPVYDNHTPFNTPDGMILPIDSSRGRKRLIHGKDCLALSSLYKVPQICYYGLPFSFRSTE